MGAAGMCGSPWQFQSPFYDGVFCVDGIITLSPVLNVMHKVGVQAQVFTIVNDEEYYYADLMRGMIKGNFSGDQFGQDMAKYTGSTTGTSRNDDICSKFTPITWQVDRKCHLISASSFDKMCADMKQQRDDMGMDLHPHGSRELVDHEKAADTHHRRQSAGGFLHGLPDSILKVQRALFQSCGAQVVRMRGAMVAPVVFVISSSKCSVHRFSHVECKLLG